MNLLFPLLGSESAEQVLIYLLAREEGYPRGIAQFYNVSLLRIQNQLEKMEAGGVLVSSLVGRTRVYQFNPRYYFLKELRILLQKALDAYPPELKDQLLMNRRRPRRTGKPL